MSPFPCVYLAGKIAKKHEESNETYWSEADRVHIRALLAPQHIYFLNPAERTDNLSDQKSVFGRDMLQVSASVAVLVDARERRGLGVGAEMMWAKMLGIPVITWAPQDSHYHKQSTSLLEIDVENWIHPFVENLSDFIVSNLEEVAVILREIFDGRRGKGPELVQDAIQHYFETEYSGDEPMQALASGLPGFTSFLASIAERSSVPG